MSLLKILMGDHFRTTLVISNLIPTKNLVNNNDKYWEKSENCVYNLLKFKALGIVWIGIDTNECLGRLFSSVGGKAKKNELKWVVKYYKIQIDMLGFILMKSKNKIKIYIYIYTNVLSTSIHGYQKKKKKTRQKQEIKISRITARGKKEKMS